MSLYLLRADTVATLVSDNPVIAATDVAPLRSATALLSEVSRLRDDAAEASATAQVEARAAGHAEGYAEGLAAAQTEARNHLFELTVRAATERQSLRAEVSRLALGVVRRVATEVGAPALIAGMVERAAADLLPDAVAIVRVTPESFDATAARLEPFPGLTVVADPALEATECLIETPLGVSHAGLEVQLAAIERAWSAALPEVVDAG